MKLKGWMEKGGHYDVEMSVDATGGNMMCKLKERMDKGGNYDMQMKGWIQKIGHYYVEIKRMDG